jgi:hypothetical protein
VYALSRNTKWRHMALHYVPQQQQNDKLRFVYVLKRNTKWRHMALHYVPQQQQNDKQKKQE